MYAIRSYYEPASVSCNKTKNLPNYGDFVAILRGTVMEKFKIVVCDHIHEEGLNLLRRDDKIDMVV